MTYPSGRTVSWDYDVAGRAVSVTGSMGGAVAVYATGITYAPHGAVSSMSIANGARTEQWCYNNRMQPVGIRLGPSSAATCDAQAGDLLRLTFGYGPAANNNGNILSQTIARPTANFNSTETYTYDPLNRLKTGAGTGWAQTYVFDRYGNRALLGTSTIPDAVQSPVVSNETEAAVQTIFPGNRWSGGTYDPAGNQISRYAGSFAYDAEGRLKSSTINSVTTTFEYDGEGRRVKKGNETYVYDAFGNLAAEYGGTVSTTGTQYLTTDHLGSTRLITNAAGAEPRCLDYFPFGEEIPRPGVDCYTPTTEPRQKFTGKERDQETGLDYFGARYFSGAQGRFTSPDIPLIDQHVHDPQSWNLYTYGRNNPLKNVDPTGNIVETVWDIANVVMDVASLGSNLAAGNWAGAAVDAVGLVADAAATIVPGVPGGAGAAIKAARAADNLVDGAQSLKRASNIADNAKAGKAFEQQAVSAVKKEQTGVVEQLTVKAQSGTKVRLDAAGKDASGNVALTEAKGSATAGLTKNQKKGFPEIQQGGATVVGKGRPGYPPGTQIPPTPVRVIRPDDLKKMQP